MWTRRHLLAAAAASLLPRSGLRAAASAEDRRFVFVLARGGWDVTRALFPRLDDPNLAVEAEARPWSVGGLSLVDHPDRPSVRALFSRIADRICLIHGIEIPSVIHQICELDVLSGDGLGRRPDWATRIAAAASDTFDLPHLRMSGPGAVGPHGARVARVGDRGELAALFDGGLPGVRTGSSSIRSRVDAAVAGQLARKRGDWSEAHDRAVWLSEARPVLAGDGRFGDQAAAAVAALESGLCRVVSLQHQLSTTWDTHAMNDRNQSMLWEDLAAQLLSLDDALARARGPGGGSLAESTVVVVLSEMGRAPTINADLGKDHWPFTSAMLWGPGVRPGAIGGYDGGFAGLPVAAGGRRLRAADIGASLLALAGAPLGPGEVPIDAVLEAL